MKSEKEFNEISEEELTQVSGGVRAGADGNYHYRCENCGAERSYPTPFESQSGPTCMDCTVKLGRRIFMVPAEG